MFVAAIALVLALCSPASHPIVAEILYDAVGDDTGHEFVEIFNPASVPWPLAGVRLEAGDGAGAGRWSLRWTGAPGDTVAARGRFVIGGALVTPPADAVAALDLQNGPDAVRLAWPDGTTEVVGYGAHTFAEYFCGAPAADVASGESLARVPDESDLGSNAEDFRAATPSPGLANLPGRDAALVGGTLALDPEQPGPGAPAILSGAARNAGAEPIAARELELRASEVRPEGEVPIASSLLEGALAPGDTTRFALPLPGLAAGKRLLRVRAALAGDGSPGNDADSLRVRVGPGPLEVTEIQFHPTQGEGEWVEVRNIGGEAVALDAFSLADRRGAPGAPAGGSGPLAPESLAVLAQDRLLLLAHVPALDSTRVWQVRPWGSLNNSDDSTGIADVVTVRESDGTPCTRVPYSAAGVPAGVPLERRGDGTWGPATDPLGSPLAPPRALPPIVGRFALTPRRLRASNATASVGWSLPWPRGRIVVDLYDFAGRWVRQVIPETAVSGRGERAWNAAGIPPGLYVMSLIARAEGGGETLALRQPLRIEGSAP